jgi:oligopeptidase B
MDSGVWVVIGMIRGGGEFGKEWHLSGAGLNKMNSVYDCRTIVEDLHRTRNVPGIIVKGRSAGAYVAGRLLSLGVEIGGLRGVVIQVGFVDNLMSMLD